MLRPDLDWCALLDLIENHSVSGLVARRLSRLDSPVIPATFRETLSSRVRAQQLFTLSMTAELFRILPSFSDARLNVALIKGPALSLLAYGEPALRSYSDLDLLVPDRDILKAVTCMRHLGFQSQTPEAILLSGKIPGEYVFRKPGTPVIVELHSERSFRYYPRGMPIDQLFARSETAQLDGRPVPVLCLLDELLLTCIHGAKDFWARLMWVSDVAALLNRHPELDWVRCRQAAAQAGAERMLRVAVQLASNVLKSKVPEALELDLQNDPAANSICREIQTWLPFAGDVAPPLLQRACYRIRMAGGGLRGTSYLVRLSLSPAHEDWQSDQEPQFWLWDVARRPFRLLRKYGPDGK